MTDTMTESTVIRNARTHVPGTVTRVVWDGNTHVMLCVDHGSSMPIRARRQAILLASRPDEWCKKCAGMVARGENLRRANDKEAAMRRLAARDEARQKRRERADVMLEHYRDGLTLEEIGSTLGITRERVRQELGQFHPEYVEYKFNRHLRDERRAQRIIEVTPKVQELYDSGSSLKQICKTLHITSSMAREALGSEYVTLPAHTNRWSDEELIGFLKRSGITTPIPYDEWRDGNTDIPSSQIIRLRFRTWGNAVEAATGLMQEPRRVRSDKIDRSEALASVVKWLKTNPESITVASYVKWSPDNGGVSTSTVRRMLGPKWRSVIATAREAIKESS